MIDEVEREAIVTAWCAADLAHAPLPADRAVVADSTALRSKIVEFVLTGDVDGELFDVCAFLGRFVADREGSPTLASLTIDAACAALGQASPSWASPARAAVVEGYCAAIVERARDVAMRTWEFPRCAVFLGDASVAIAAGHPSDDPELLAEWAARVANAAANAGVRSAHVSGLPAARAAVEDALTLAGIALR